MLRYTVLLSSKGEAVNARITAASSTSSGIQRGKMGSFIYQMSLWGNFSVDTEYRSTPKLWNVLIKKRCITFTRSYYTGPGNSLTYHLLLASTISASFGFSFNQLFFISVLFSCNQLPLQWNWNGYRSQSTEGNVYDLHNSRAHHLTCSHSSWA